MYKQCVACMSGKKACFLEGLHPTSVQQQGKHWLASMSYVARSLYYQIQTCPQCKNWLRSQSYTGNP